MEKTTCYKCEDEIEVPDLTIVHPLCQECEGDFDNWFTEQLGVFKKPTCPDCGSEITERNELIAEAGSPEKYGSCVDCYDPTPEGYEYSKGFEMDH
jgi:hypothetical protein